MQAQIMSHHTSFFLTILLFIMNISYPFPDFLMAFLTAHVCPHLVYVLLHHLPRGGVEAEFAHRYDRPVGLGLRLFGQPSVNREDF